MTETPQLDRALAVHDVSDQIGQFVMEHLADQGIVLARWMWEQLPCSKQWVIRDGEPTHLMSGWPQRDTDRDIDPFECPCSPSEIPSDRPTHTYKHARWSLVQFHRSDGWINDELARFFGLDPAEMERERSSLLASLRNGRCVANRSSVRFPLRRSRCRAKGSTAGGFKSRRLGGAASSKVTDWRNGQG